MPGRRKISGEASGLAVVVLVSSHGEMRQGGTMEGVGVRLQARREVVQQLGPQYRSASSARKRELLDACTQITGYHRKYAMWLLNHQREQGAPMVQQARPRRYGADVQEALVQVWDHANRICTKCLIPFLSTFVEALERHGHLHLSETCREHLLSMSVATADRLLRQARGRGLRGLSTTRAGTLLKQQIPIRTFQQWDERQPGFLEMDVVAHCGADGEGNYLSTLTLTDIATGWTECLPLLYKSQETVLEALQEARTLFPFPILGLDTDNGGEFINELLLSYCEQEHLTFTRGRPSLKNDQCYVEQKNGAIVRQVVGYDRFLGVQAYQQLGEVYQALRLYANCFQPSLKLQGKQYDGRKVHLVYDRAKTPLQRLHLSKVLPALKEQALQQAFQALDPVSLLQQVKEIQQALFVHARSASLSSEENVPVPVRQFCVEACMKGPSATGVLIPESAHEQHPKVDAIPTTSSLLEWHRTCHDPFKEVWELIASWVLAHPERTSGEILRELQRLFPDRYQSSHLRTLQRGLRKIRARLRATEIMQWPKEETQTDVPDRSFLREQGAGNAGVPDGAITLLPLLDTDHVRTADTFFPQCIPQEEAQPAEIITASTETLPASGRHLTAARRRSSLTIEQAIQAYREEQRKARRQPKTLEWHQTALLLFQEYLVSECQCLTVDQVTQTQVRGWLVWLCETPTARGTFRSAGTRESYARSARAFCRWLVCRKYVKQTPFARLIVSSGKPSAFCLLEPAEWERLLLACRPTEGKMVLAEQVAARNEAILWVLAETGMRTAELCGLCISDVDREQSRLRVRKKGGKQRWVPLKQEGLSQVLFYLDQTRLQEVRGGKGRRVGEEPLFLSETGCPLTENGIALLFGRLRKRAGITRKGVNPSLLRESFAVRYLQAGGDLFTLREWLGQEESVVVKRSLRMSK